MNFNPRTRVAVVTEAGPQITGTVIENNDATILVRLDRDGEVVRGNGGDFYELTDASGRPQIGGQR
ncbi:hypothetical protein ABGB07_36330 [Micromonosporaceae bacterium B7E4]